MERKKEKKIMTMLFVAMLVMLVSARAVSATVTVEKLTQLTDGPYREMAPSWSPDGAKIAYANQKSNLWNDAQIWIVDEDGTNKRQITYEYDLGTISWSPDGEEIAFVRCEGFWYNIYKINVDGSGLIPLAADDSIVETHPCWSTDGSKILYVVRYSGIDVAEIWVMDADGSNKERLTTGRFDFCPSWSTDSTKIVYATKTAGDWDIWIMDADGTNQKQITDDTYVDDCYPTWSPDDTMIAYASGDEISSNWNIWVMKADGSEKTKLTTDDKSYGPDWSPDGNKIVYYSGFQYPPEGDIWMMELSETHIPATIDIDPDTLNIKSNGEWITAYIELPTGYDVNDIDVPTINLEHPSFTEPIPVDSSATATVGDYDIDGISDLMVKFDRNAAVAYLGTEDVTEGETGTDNYEDLTLTGELTDGTPFEGSDAIRVIDKGKSK